MKRTTVAIAALAACVAVVSTRPVVAQHQGTAVFRLVEATVADVQHALQTRLITSEQLVRMYLARIAAYDDAGPGVNAFIYVNPNAVAEARQLDRLRHPGRARRPLDGVPVALKDIIDTADMPTTGGSLTLVGSTPPKDAFITKKLRAAGAVILGKLTLTEFANFITTGMPAGYSGYGQYGFNPYDPRPLPGGDGRPVLTPGGSSSGSGIAVNANLATLAVGTETSGSILSPANANGVVGIKPTVGLVSRTGIIPITADQDTAGPLTRTVADAALLLGVLAGFDPEDPATAACLIPGIGHTDYTQDLDKKALTRARIAVPPFPANRSDIMVAAIDALRAEGAYVELIPALAPQLGICVSVPAPAGCSTVLLYGQKRDMNAYLARRGTAPVHTLSDIIALNNVIPGALKYGQVIFEAADMLDLSPGSPDTLRYLDDRAQDLLLARGALDGVYRGADGAFGTSDDFDAILLSGNNQAGTAAKAGYPSVSVPGGFLPPADPVENPFPSTVTFTGTAFSEPRLIALAYAFEQATKHRVPPDSTPPLPTDVVRRHD
ncbi:MAG: amidase family protein [Vicinamibacterales bacterium]